VELVGNAYCVAYQQAEKAACYPVQTIRSVHSRFLGKFSTATSLKARVVRCIDTPGGPHCCPGELSEYADAVLARHSKPLTVTAA
jgi:hypothetical protein